MTQPYTTHSFEVYQSHNIYQWSQGNHLEEVMPEPNDDPTRLLKLTLKETS